MIVPLTNTLIHRLGRSLLLMALIVLPAMAMAQEEEVLIDTTVVVPGEAGTSAMVEAAEDDSYEKEPPAPPELRIVPDSTVSKLKKDKDFEYANNPDYWKKEKTKEKKQDDSGGKSAVEGFNGFFSGDGIRLFFYVLIGGLLLWVIYRIVVVNNLFVTRSSKTRKQEEEEQEEVLDTNSLDARISAAIAAGNYRAAVRFLFLKTLNGLHEKGWIRYHAQGTNHEYLGQVTPYGVGKEFRFLTHVYEYVWYGEFPLGEDQFKQVHQHFQQFYNSAKL